MLASRALRPPCRHIRRKNGATRPQFVPLPRTRGFHATASRQNSLLDIALYPPHVMLECLHTVLPWYLTIPCSAFIARGLLVGTLGARVRASLMRYTALHPLRNAIAIGIRDRLMRKGGFTTPKEARIETTRAIKKEMKALDERWNCSLRGYLAPSIAQIPIFLIMSEVIRRISGTKDGLLKMALNALGLAGKSDASGAVVGGEYGANVDANPWFDPSLAVEGMLWFPDLIVPDPTGVLPFVVSALMFTNVYTTNNDPSEVAVMSTFQRRLRKVLLTASLLIGPLCQDVPASLMLYWTASTSSTMLWNIWLDKKYPLWKGFMPCKRPLLPSFMYTPPKTTQHR